MSKVVKKVGRAIGKIVKGVSRVVKKITKSKIFKAVVVAAAVYFGGAALAGGFSSSAAGGSFLSGMGTGVSNAAASLSSAWGSAMSGNFAQAGSALSSGFQGQVAGAAGQAAAGMTQAQMLAAQNAGIEGATALTNQAAATAFPNAAANAGLQLTPAATQAASGGLAEGMIGAAKIQAGTALAGNLISGYGQQKAAEEQRAYEQQQQQAALDRYNENVGTNWWTADANQTQTAGTAADAYAPATPAATAQAPQSGLVNSAVYGPAPGQSYSDYMRQRMQKYNPYGTRTA